MSMISKVYMGIVEMKKSVLQDGDIQHICEMINVPEKEFRKSFLRVTGLTPREYFSQLKSETQYLKQSDSENRIWDFSLLNDVEKIVAFFPAPEHCQYQGNLLYEAHKVVYDSLVAKGYFDEKNKGYRVEAKQITEQYEYSISNQIMKVLPECQTLSELYCSTCKMERIPLLLFYLFIKNLAENGLLVDTKFADLYKCAKCSVFLNNIYDVGFFSKYKRVECDKGEECPYNYL